MKNTAMKERKGFTVLELIVVLIIVAVLASISLPRFFKVIESSRSAEALISISALRQAMERCYLQNNGSYLNCTLNKLSIENPGNSPNSHFTYQVVNGSAVLPSSPTFFSIGAIRNTLDGGNAGGGFMTVVNGISVPAGASYVILNQSDDTVTITGGGAFRGIR